MVYPFVTKTNRDLRKELIGNKIFVAKYWPNVHQLSNYETEYTLANRVVAIPCDQRYGEVEMKGESISADATYKTLKLKVGYKFAI